MITAEFVAALRRQGIQLSVEGTNLRCSAPEGILNPALKRELAARKVDIMRWLGMAGCPRTGKAPLSSAQRRLWFLQQCEPENPFYNVPVAVRISGRLQPDTLEQSLLEVVRRHEILRTTFGTENGEPIQVIYPKPLTAGQKLLDLTDLQQFTPEARDRQVMQLAAAAAAQPLDLAAGPPFRAHLLRLSETEHVLLLVMHHIVTDMWSRSVLVREASAFYDALANDGEVNLPPLPLQYADYAVWQREQFQGETLEALLSYWRRQLSGCPPLLPLPVDQPRPAIQTYRGAVHDFVVPRELTDALKAFSRQEKVTPFTTLLAVFQTLLARYSGEVDVCVGSPTAGRNRRDLEDLIGFFVNTLVLRGDLSGNPTFRQLLKRTKEMILGARAHEDLPFERLVEELQPERHLSHHPLFQVMLAMENAPMPVLNMAGLTLQFLQLPNVTAKFDLTLLLEENDRALEGRLQYNRDLFDPTTVANLASHFLTLLSGCLENADSRVGAVALLPQEEKCRILVNWSSAEKLHAEESCIHELFAAQVARTPEVIAVRDDAGHALTYKELDRRANCLAQRLHAAGVGPNDLVGLWLERSVDIPVGLMAILKAGGAYLPIDPTTPRERVCSLLQNGGCSVLITHRCLIAKFQVTSGRVFCLDEEDYSLAGDDEPPPASRSRPDDLVYVIYTSGSTGQPKGVAVEHGNLVQYVQAIQGRLCLPAGSGYAWVSTLSADLGNTAVFPALLSGGCLHVISRACAMEPAALGQYFQCHDIDCLKIVPSHLAALLNSACAPQLIPKRVLVLGGEASTWELIGRIEALAPGCRILNHYGPTETTVGVLTYEIPRERAGCNPGGTVPLGRPLAGTRVYLLDAQGHLVPPNVSGEIHIGGGGVARGYLHEPGLTADRFVPDPFVGEHGARMYRTGDLARYNADGMVEFIGRADGQVKIRGFRVEVSEIEVALRKRPEVRDVLVMRVSRDGADPKLLAYIVSPSGTELTPTMLRQWLQSVLPEYMIPSGFVILDRFPLGPNGKVDRQALLALEIPKPARGLDEGPHNPVEEAVAAIWREVIGVEAIGMHDNFFELGGHSLLAIQIISRVREIFQIELAVRGLFEAPTIAGLSRLIEAKREERRRTEGAVELSPLRPVARRGPLPLSFAQQRIWFLHQLAPDSPFYNVPGAVRLVGRLHPETLERCINEVVKRQEALRTGFRAADGEPVQFIEPHLRFELPLVDLPNIPPAERDTVTERFAREDATRPFDLGQPPLFRMSLLRFDLDHHALVVTLNHIISDGWSVRVLMREVACLYEAFSSGLAPSLPELPIQYADFAVWQRQRLQGDVLQSQLDYWKARLEGLTVLQLPTDRPRPPVQSFRGATEPVRFTKELTRVLQEFCNREGITLFTVLLAGLTAILSRYTGQEDVAVGTPVAGRTQKETEGLIGFFLNTLVLRTDLSGDPNFMELVGRVVETVLGAYSHPDVPFERLVDECHLERSLAHNPLVQVMLVSLDIPVTVLEVPGLEFATIPIDNNTAKFDFTLVFEQNEEGIVGSVEYSTDLFEVATVRRVIDHLQNLLEAAMADPFRPISKLLLSEAELHRVVALSRGAVEASPGMESIDDLLALQAARTPDAVALSSAGRSWSYHELETRAGRIADRLKLLGVGPGTVVGLYTDRSPDAVAAILGIWKAGSAYLPLEPDLPQERLDLMLSETRAAVLMAPACAIPALTRTGIRIEPFDAEADLTASVAQHDENTRSVTRGDFAPNRLAYVIYTSGSTGRPKGVLLPHTGLCNVVRNQRRMFGLTPKDRVLQFAAWSFDGSLFEMLMALGAGASLHLASREELTPGLGLVDFLRQQRVTAAVLTPSVLAALPKADLAELALLCAAGEACSGELVRRWAPGRRFFNLYGPTEATIWSTATECRADEEHPSIGFPIANTEAYVLDARMEPVPLGVPGELYLGGIGLARGYLARPELTRERFVANPFRNGPDARLYRTGDRVRRRLDGSLEFLARVDDQIKVLGCRVEPGEIESVLGRHPNIQEVAVAVVGRRPEEHRLVAYYVPRLGASPSAEDFRRYLRARLPEYMVPAAFVDLPALPRTSSGKTDRRRLREWRPTVSEVPSASSGPRTPVEQLVAAAWREVLQIENVTVHDDFFDLGGNSLLAAQVVARLRNRFGPRISVRSLFEAPTLESLAAQIEATGSTRALSHTISRRTTKGHPPLSFEQQRLWFLDQLGPRTSTYNVPLAVRIEGDLDEAALERSFQEIIARHESLRTSFGVEGDHPVQVIAPYLKVPFQVIDLTALPATMRESEVERLGVSEATHPFELARGPLLRVCVVRLAPKQSALYLTMHHIVCDAWSVGIMLEELAARYKAFHSGQKPSWAPLPVQYADYAVWQREWLVGPELDAQLAYWKNHLSGALPSLDLPLNKPRPAVQTFRGGRGTVRIEQRGVEAFQRLSRAKGGTLFMAVLAAFKTLLFRYTDQTDVIVGTPVANRKQPGLEGLIGLFVNTLALRTDLSGDPTFSELLERLRDVALGAFAHADLPFEKLVEELEPGRDLSRHPIFQVLFTFQNAPLAVPQLPDLTLSTLDVDRGSSKFDLTLSLAEEDGGALAGWLEYNADLFESETVQRFARHLERLIDAVAQDPDRRLSEYPLLADDERWRIIVKWNRTEMDYPRSASLPDLFEAQVARTPNDVAVVHGDRHLTYGDLDRRASALAHVLQSLSVGPEVCVGICLDRSLDLLVGLLGVLKAGGAYVPLDPAYPQERLELILRNARARIILSRKAIREELALAAPDSQWIDIDSIGSTERSQPPVRKLRPENLAYLIHTSGSTGAPKAVAITHANAVAFLSWVDAAFTKDQLSGVLASTSICFDLSIFELFGPLSCGGTVILVGNALELLSSRPSGRLTLINTVPSAITELLQAGAIPPTVRTINLAGEPLRASLVDRLYALGFIDHIFNLYGPSETTTYSTCMRIDPRTERPPGIGRPIANTQVYILDSTLKPVPVGIVGEIYIGGAGVARGYLHDAESTAETFVPNPFSTDPYSRLYRTGDLGRHRSDGNLEFLGRRDHQVKVRGFRIELQEVEARLLEEAGILDAVVLAQPDAEGRKELVAYVVPSPGGSVTAEWLRTRLQRRLPAYMVPSLLIALDSLPLTPNGKVDRKALPAVSGKMADPGTHPIAPRTSTEKALAELWAATLRLERVGIHDNFFALGGHSLLVAKLVMTIRDRFGIAVPMQSLFETPTVAGLAESIDRLQRGEGVSQLKSVSVSHLEEEALLDPSIVPDGEEAIYPDEARHLLLTGATGYLGTFLLHEFLIQSQADIYCLVRAESVAEGREKLARALVSHGLWEEAYRDRIVAVPGDLAQPLLGLAPDHFRDLARTLDGICHNGALVNFALPYDSLRSANVLGTREVLRLACQARVKPVDFVSTISVLSGASHMIFEEDGLEGPPPRTGSYAQSKWVAEKLVRTAASRGLPVRIYRPGHIAGHSRTGSWNRADFLSHMIKCFLELGCIPDVDINLNLTPVDYVSQAVVRLSRSRKGIGRTYHLINPEPLSLEQMVQWIRQQGYEVEVVPYKTWRERLSRMAGATNAGIPHSLLSILPEDSEFEASAKRESLCLDAKEARKALAESGLICPPANEKLLDTYFAAFIRSGFLKPSGLLSRRIT